MTHTPHELSADFPEHVERIHALKLADPEFREMVERYHALNRAVHRAETLVEPMTGEAETDLRKERAQLKDTIYRQLTAA